MRFWLRFHAVSHHCVCFCVWDVCVEKRMTEAQKTGYLVNYLLCWSHMSSVIHTSNCAGIRLLARSSLFWVIFLAGLSKSLGCWKRHGDCNLPVLLQYVCQVQCFKKHICSFKRLSPFFQASSLPRAAITSTLCLFIIHLY